MVNRKKLLAYGFLSLLIASLAGYFGYQAVENRVIQQGYVSVVAVKPDRIIEPYTPILDRDLTYFSMAKDHLIPGVITDPQQVIGKIVWQKVGAGQPILDWQLTDGKLLPDPTKREMSFEFPLTDFTPMTNIRKGDTVFVWVKYHRDTQALAELGEPSFFKKTNTAADLLFTATLAGVKDSGGAEIFSLPPPKLSTQLAADVAQRSGPQGSDTQDRLAASFRGKPTSLPTRLVLNLTEEQFRALSEAKQYGDLQIGVRFVKGGDSS